MIWICFGNQRDKIYVMQTPAIMQMWKVIICGYDSSSRSIVGDNQQADVRNTVTKAFLSQNQSDEEIHTVHLIHSISNTIANTDTMSLYSLQMEGMCFMYFKYFLLL